MINNITRETTCMGGIRKRLHRPTNKVEILKVKSQSSGQSWGCILKKLRRKHPLRYLKKILVTKFRGP